MKTRIFLLAVLLLFTTSFFAQNPNFYIYLCFGQSNMEGQGVIETQDRTVDNRFKVLQALDCSNLGRTKATWYTAIPPTCQCSSGLSPADYFGRTMTENLPDSITIGIINVSVAGCDIRLFDKDKYLDYDSTYTASWFLNKVKAYEGNPYKYLIDLAKLAQQDGVIKGILLHQGETNNGDSQWPLYVQTIYDNIMNDLSLSPDSVPLLAGEVVNADQGGTSASMNSIINLLPNTIPTAYVISSSGCPADASLVHFSSEGYREMGRRYAEKMLSLITQAGSAAYLNTSQTTLSLGYQEGSIDSFIITSNIEWTLSSSETWLILSSSSGEGDATITLTAQKNPDTSTRTAIISVSGTGVTSNSVTVTQGGAPAYLNISASMLQAGFQEGSDSTINISSNTDWTVTDDVDWITVRPESGSGNETLTVSYSANMLATTRSGTITISGTGVSSQTVTITQDGMKTLTVSPSEFTNMSGWGKITVMSNTSWTVSYDEWIQVTPTSGEGNMTLIAYIPENCECNPRFGKICLTGVDVDTQCVKIEQYQTIMPPVVWPSPQNVGSAAGNINFSYDSGPCINVPYVYSASSWLTSQSFDGGVITVSFTANALTTTRDGELIFQDRCGNLFAATIIQEGAPAYLNTSSSTLSIGYQEGSTNTFNVTSNIDWTATSSEVWLTLTPNSGSENSTVTLSAHKNPNTSSRTATVSVTGTGVTTQPVTVTQEGAPVDLHVSSSTLQVGYQEGSTVTLNVTSNTEWTIAFPEDWLTVSRSSGTGDASILITAKENTNITTRLSTITITGKGIPSKTVTVTQEGAPPFLETSVTSLPLSSAEGASGTFDITSNTSWTVSSSETWLTMTNAGGTANGKVTVTAQKNPTINTRNATVTIKASGLTDMTITISQAGSPTGIMDSEDVQIRIYPNPANNILIIEGIIQEAQITIFDIQGRLVLKREIGGRVIDIRNLPSGVYSIVLEGNNEIIKRKFVKE